MITEDYTKYFSNYNNGCDYYEKITDTSGLAKEIDFLKHDVNFLLDRPIVSKEEISEEIKKMNIDGIVKETIESLSIKYFELFSSFEKTQLIKIKKLSNEIGDLKILISQYKDELNWERLPEIIKIDAGHMYSLNKNKWQRTTKEFWDVYSTFYDADEFLTTYKKRDLIKKIEEDDEEDIPF